MSKLSDKTASELKKIFENKEASAQEIASEYLRKAQNLNKEINAFISFNED